MNDYTTELEKIVLQHKHLYYAGIPLISDAEYDKLEAVLRDMQPTSPVLQAVGYNIKDGTTHTFPMLSIQKALTPEELYKWFVNTNKANRTVVVSHKIDGLAVELIYINGLLHRAVTRGDGTKGEDVTRSVLHIDEIPIRIPIREEVRVRGEIYMKKSVFSHFKSMDNSLTDPRNTAVGALKNSDPTNEKNHKLSFFAYKIIMNGCYFPITSYATELGLLESLGFVSVPFSLCNTYDAVIERFTAIEQGRATLNYKIDGIVIHINDTSFNQDAGFTSHHPKYAICLKFEAEEAITTVRKIEWSMSRNGTLTPVAVFDPVNLAGATIERAKAHNLDFLYINNINVGNCITIVRSGDVIPKIIQGDVDATKTNTVCDSIPTTCPYCAERTEQVKIVNTNILRCTNNNCYKRHSLKIEHFCKEVGIKGFGEAACDSMTTEGVRDIHGIWGGSALAHLSSEVIREKLEREINATIGNTSIEDFLSALGIPDFSRSSIKKWLAADKQPKTKEYILSVPDTLRTVLGDSAYFIIKQWLMTSENIFTLKSMWLVLGIKETQAKEIKQSKITGKKICITGTLSRPRPELETIITDNGGIVVGSVSKKTDFLLCGENAGSKKDKADECGVIILSESDFNGMVS